MALGPVTHHGDHAVADLVAAKGDRTVAVCIPARDEASTIGPIVERIRAELMDAAPLVDELVVVDDHSTDATAQVAEAAGARVVWAASILPGYATGPGKGQALWKSVYATVSDVIVWCDADVVDFDARFVRGLVAPLLTDPDVVLVKGFYDRPETDGRGGGRVTELVARPLLALYFPELVGIRQPLGGEFAARRSALEQVPFVEGYGVDLALVVDLAAAHGPGAVAQVDLDERVDRNRPLSELGPQALAVLQAALHRAGVAVPDAVALDGGAGEREVSYAELPPLAGVAAYRGRETATGAASGGRQLS